MKWLTNLEKYNISFNIHILQKNDYIIINHVKHNKQIIYILEGFIHVIKVFTNGEKICTQLLYKDDLINNIQLQIIEKTNYYYRVIAITKTAILTIPTKELINKIYQNTYLIKKFHIINNYTNQDMVNILSHKNTKKRLIQLLLVIIKRFGQINKNNIIIPFNLQQYTLATITGSQRITINRIMYNLKKNNIIYYNKNKIIIYNLLQLIKA